MPVYVLATLIESAITSMTVAPIAKGHIILTVVSMTLIRTVTVVTADLPIIAQGPVGPLTSGFALVVAQSLHDHVKVLITMIIVPITEQMTFIPFVVPSIGVRTSTLALHAIDHF